MSFGNSVQNGDLNEILKIADKIWVVKMKRHRFVTIMKINRNSWWWCSLEPNLGV